MGPRESTIACFARHFQAVLADEWNHYVDLDVAYGTCELEATFACLRILSPTSLEFLTDSVRREYGLRGRLFHLDWEAMENGLFAPIVERHGDHYIVLDGAHRLFCAHSLGVRSADVIVLSSANELDPCARLHALDSLCAEDIGERTHERIFEEFNADMFRPIRKVLQRVGCAIRDERRR